MKVSNRGKDLIKEFEGFRKEAYRCSANKLTIGYGHLIKDNETDLKTKNITKEDAEMLLNEDIKRFEEYLNDIIKKTKITLKQNQFDALISFIYNTGYFKDAMLIRIGLKDIKAIGEAILLYKHTNGKELLGLTKRRQKEYELFFS